MKIHEELKPELSRKALRRYAEAIGTVLLSGSDQPEGA